jgi:hypothetical protein
MARPYRSLSVQEVDVPLTEMDLVPFLLGREVYRRSDYLVLRNGEDAALVAVRRESDEPLFSPVVEARVLARPDEVVSVTSPETDASNATALAKAALAHARPGARAYLVQGRYEHVNFIFEPAPFRVRVTEVVPPEPPKLFAMAEQVVAFDEDMPPVDLILDAVDIRDLASAHPAGRYLLPCRGSGVDLPAAVTFLDTRPAERDEWLLIGCERSVQFHRHFYGDEPEQVDICPRRRLEGRDGVPTLAKCCLLERGVELDGEVAIVPVGPDTQHVKIVWHVRNASGAELGNVGQENDVPHGALSGAWGDIAYVVALAAGEGIMQVLARSALPESPVAPTIAAASPEPSKTGPGQPPGGRTSEPAAPAAKTTKSKGKS